MSNYTITTNFGAKDSLPSGNAGKVIKGSEFTTEFTNIQTAVATKADTVSPTFTGAVTFDAAVTVNSTATITGDLTVDTNTLFVDVSENKVGIGTTSPDVKLDVTEAYDTVDNILSNGNFAAKFSSSGSGDTGRTQGILLSGQDGNARGVALLAEAQSTNNAHDFVIATSGVSATPTERMRITSSGNVGIGTDSPTAKATIEDGDFARLDLNLSNATGTTIADIRGLVEGTEKWRIGKTVSSSDDFTINVGSTERMRIDSSGHLLVGTTSPTPYSFTTDSGICWGGGTNLPNSIARESTASCLILNKTGTQSGSSGIQDFRYDGTSVGNISISSTAVALNSTSDERLKENITDSADAGSKVDAIQIRQFDWKADGSHQDYGVIAQELVEVAPEAVHQPVDEEDMMGVDYSKLVPMLIKEVQSLRSRVAELENI